MLLGGSAVSLRDGTSRWVERANPSLGSPQSQTECWEVTRSAKRAFWGNAIHWRNSTKRGFREDRCSSLFPLGSLIVAKIYLKAGTCNRAFPLFRSPQFSRQTAESRDSIVVISSQPGIVDRRKQKPVQEGFL